MRIRNTAMSVAACTVVVTAVAACGSSGAPASAANSPPAVTHQPEHKPTKTTSPIPRSRPREQLDASSSQTAALYAPYQQCLAEHVARGQINSSHVHKGVPRWKTASPVALKACLPYKPLPPWQYDPANPKALGFAEQVAACLHRHGVRYADVDDPAGADEIGIALGGSQNDPTSITLGLRYTPICEEQVVRAGGS